MPPQSLPFPLMKVALMFLKTPSIGTSPSKWLKDRFKNFKKTNCSKNFGIWPDKLLLEGSNFSRPLNDPKDGGMIPWKRFPFMMKSRSITQLPRLGSTIHS